jgi:hypothetical protein
MSPAEFDPTLLNEDNLRELSRDQLIDLLVNKTNYLLSISTIPLANSHSIKSLQSDIKQIQSEFKKRERLQKFGSQASWNKQKE